MKFNLFMTAILAVMLSMVVSKIVYFGFTPAYGANFFSHRAFEEQFGKDGYQYRVLSKWLVLGVDNLLARGMPEKGAEARIGVGSPLASERFYYAIYYVNTIFLALTSLMVVLLLGLEKRFGFSERERMLIVFFVPVLIGLTQYTVHYYDLSSYFLELLTLYVFLKSGNMTTVMALIVVSALNRESAEVSVAMISLLLITKYPGVHRAVLNIVGMLLCCGLTYLALRLAIQGAGTAGAAGTGGVAAAASAAARAAAGRMGMGEGQQLEMDMVMMGVIFWVLFIYLPFALAASEENKWLIGAFLLLCLPYIGFSLRGGDFWAVRLLVPPFLGALFLSQLEMAGAGRRVSEFGLSWLKARLR